jgi:hypothetical protein
MFHILANRMNAVHPYGKIFILEGDVWYNADVVSAPMYP